MKIPDLRRVGATGSAAGSADGDSEPWLDSLRDDLLQPPSDDPPSDETRLGLLVGPDT